MISNDEQSGLKFKLFGKQIVPFVYGSREMLKMFGIKLEKACQNEGNMSRIIELCALMMAMGSIYYCGMPSTLSIHLNFSIYREFVPSFNNAKVLAFNFF